MEVFSLVITVVQTTVCEGGRVRPLIVEAAGRGLAPAVMCINWWTLFYAQ